MVVVRAMSSMIFFRVNCMKQCEMMMDVYIAVISVVFFVLFVAAMSCSESVASSGVFLATSGR